jgi:hypothetical protein
VRLRDEVGCIRITARGQLHFVANPTAAALAGWPAGRLAGLMASRASDS